jgi:2-polyprenyl-3-methyl-5-hydroxy-6-metoxy-1,4-benzoquinol methylase
MSKTYQSGADKLRSPQRVKLLEVERVVELCLDSIDVKSVLDVGTGSGLFAEAFMQMVDEVTGIDTNPEMIEAAKGYAPEVKFQEGAAESIPSADDEYDLVFLGHVLHESDTPLGVLHEAKRSAKQRVVVLEWPYQVEEKGPSIEDRLEPDEVTEYAKQAGFEKIESIQLLHMILYRFTI